MLRKTAAAALALGLISGSAYATEHEVAIVAGAFYPEITYVQPGDTVVIYNADDVPRKVFGDTFHFVTPNLHTGEEYTLTVTEGMPNEYFGKSFADDDSSESFGEGATDAEQIADSDEDGKKMRGVLSFAPPPLDE